VIERDVREHDDFNRDLTAAFAALGEPTGSLPAFRLLVLPAVWERFMFHWDELPQEIPGRKEYRLWISWSPVLGFFTVRGQLAPDGVVELVALEVDPEGLIHV
jgi:hypothetical protein